MTSLSQQYCCGQNCQALFLLTNESIVRHKKQHIKATDKLLIFKDILVSLESSFFPFYCSLRVVRSLDEIPCSRLCFWQHFVSSFLTINEYSIFISRWMSSTNEKKKRINNNKFKDFQTQTYTAWIAKKETHHSNATMTAWREWNCLKQFAPFCSREAYAHKKSSRNHLNQSDWNDKKTSISIKFLPIHIHVVVGMQLGMSSHCDYFVICVSK